MGPAWLTRQWLDRVIQDRGPRVHNPEEDARACMHRNTESVDYCKNGVLLVYPCCDWIAALGPDYGDFRADFEPIFGAHHTFALAQSWIE